MTSDDIVFQVVGGVFGFLAVFFAQRGADSWRAYLLWLRDHRYPTWIPERDVAISIYRFVGVAFMLASLHGLARSVFHLDVAMTFVPYIKIIVKHVPTN